FLILLGADWIGAQALNVRLDGNVLRFTARDLHFIAGEALTRLHNGTSVNYTFHITLSGEGGNATLAQSIYRFVVSYDLWEEKFAVTRLEPAPRSVSHLSAAAAESWCLDSVGIAADVLTPERPFWVLLEYEVEPAAAGSPDPEDTTLAR